MAAEVLASAGLDVLMVEEGALPEQIDKVMVDFGYTMGPFAVSDLSGGHGRGGIPATPPDTPAASPKAAY